MERGRSFSGGWNSSTRPRPPRIATVKPVSKSLSEDDLMKAVDDKQTITPRVFSRLKIQDLTALQKDSLISELEKCLGELETEHDTTHHLAEEYNKVENERNQLLNELDIAFLDLQEYMKKQKEMEEQTNTIENDREELIRENEYLKAVLSNRAEIKDNKCEEENRSLHERVKDLEQKNTQLIDEINDLYEDRQTLISSLLNLKSDEVDEVIKRRSRSSSIASRDSTCDAERMRLLSEDFEEQLKELQGIFNENAEVHEGCKKLIIEMKAERTELKDAFRRVKRERDETEKELDQMRSEKEKLSGSYNDKIKEMEEIVKDRNDKNLSISELKHEKRTLQRQLDHMRETNRVMSSKVASLKEENSDLNASLTALASQMNVDEGEEIDRLSEQIQCLQQELEQADSENKQLITRVHELETTQGDQMENLKRLEELEDEKLNLESDCSSLLKELENCRSKIDELNKGKANSEKLVQNLSKQNKDISKERDTLRHSYKQLSEKNGELENENVRFKRDALKLRSDNSTMDKQMKNRINTLEIEISKLTNAKETAEKMLRRKEEEEKEYKDTVKRLEKQLLEKDDEICSGKTLSHANEEILAAENEKFEVLKVELEKAESRNKQLEKVVSEHRIEIKQAKDSKDALQARIRTLESESANLTNNLNSLKIEKDKVAKKNRQLEKSCQENSNLQNEVKQLKDSNDVLIKRYRVLEEGSNKISNDYENLKLQKDRLVQNSTHADKATGEISNLRVQLNNMQNAIDDLENRNKVLKQELDKNTSNTSKTKEDEREKYSMLLVKYDNLCQQYESINTQLKTTHTALEEKCQHLRSITKENERLKQRLNESPNQHNPSIQAQLEDKLQVLTKELETLKDNKEKMTRDVQYLLMSRREEAETQFTNTKNQIEHERDTMKAKYELLRVDCDKMNKEKEHYLMTIDTLRDENGKLHNQVRKQRLISSSTQDLMIQRLRDDNDTLEKQLEVIKNSLAKSNAENKSLVDRLSRTDENTVTTIRSLKARKNELQLQVNTLTHENGHLKKKLSEKKESEKSNETYTSTPDVKRKFAQLELTEAELRDKYANALTKIGELEADNKEYTRKFKESEALMYDLQQALAQANDLAMQKSLEATKIRRSLEKKAERLIQENTELKRKVYFTGKSDGEISPTSLFPRFQPTLLRATTEDSDSFKNRKVSLPATIQSESSGPNNILSKSRQNSLKKAGQQQSFEYPMLDPTFESKLQIGPMGANEISGKKVIHLPTSGNLTSVKSNRVAPSQQEVEMDLSKQLRELLDLSNDLTTVKEDDQKSHASEESMAPPIPPPPMNYETLDRKKLSIDQDSNKKNEDWV